MRSSSIPGWAGVSLAELGHYVNGYAFKPEDWSEHGLPIVRIAQITGSSAECDHFAGKLSDTFRIVDDDLIFSWSGTLAVVRWKGGPAWLNQHLFRVDPADWIDKGFLFHVLSASVADMDKRAHGSTMKHIKRGELRESRLSVPQEPAEQRQIAHILDTLDTQIHQTEKLIAKLEQIKQGLLTDLLTRGIDENGQLRPPPEQAPHLYKESPLGWIPGEWGLQALGTISQIVSGITLGGTASRFSGVRVPYLRVANVQDGFLDLSEVKSLWVSQGDAEKFALQEGDVLMNEGGDYDKLGRGTIWRGEIADCIHQNHVFRVRADRAALLPEFLAAYSASPAGKSYFLRASKQSTNLASINSTQLKAFQVPLPNLDECSGQLIPDSILRFSSAATGEMPSLNV